MVERFERSPRSEGYRGTSLIRNRPPVGPYSSPMPRTLRGSQGGGCFLMSEVPMYGDHLAADIRGNVINFQYQVKKRTQSRFKSGPCCLLSGEE